MKKDFKFYLVCFIIIALVATFTIYVGSKIIHFVSSPEAFRLWVKGHGVFGPITYILFTIVQIVACFIPGEPFELVAGYAFGLGKGFILCLIAEALGSFVVIFLTKKYGMKLVNLFFSKEKIDSLTILKTSKKRFLIFTILFCLPGTPKDLLCYYAGLTDFSLVPLLIVTSLGRIPAIITSVMGADALGNKNYILTFLVFVLTLALSLIGILIYRKITNKKVASNN